LFDQGTGSSRRSSKGGRMKTILAVAIFATLAPAFAEAGVVCKKSGEQTGAIKKICYYNCGKWDGGLNQDVYEHCPRWVSRWGLNRNSQWDQASQRSGLARHSDGDMAENIISREPMTCD